MVAKIGKIKKGDRQARIFLIFLGIITIGFIGFLFFSNFKISQKRTELSGQIGEMQSEIRALEEKNSQLEQGIFQTGKDIYWEERIREQGYKKPGEEQVVISPLEEKKQEALEEKNLWQKILEKIGF